MICLVVSSVMSVTEAAIITRVVMSIVTWAAAGGCILTPTVPLRIFHVPNTNPSESRVPNTGLSNGNVFLKGAGQQRRLCSMDPQLQQRSLYCTQAWRRAPSERRGAHNDSSVFKMFFVTVHTIS